MNKTINFKCDENYKEKIETRAKELGLTVSTYIKMLINSDVEKSKKEVK